MPTSPPGSVFPALVVVGHIVTLIAVWQWRVRKKQGKAQKEKEKQTRGTHKKNFQGDRGDLRRKLDLRFFWRLSGWVCSLSLSRRPDCFCMLRSARWFACSLSVSLPSLVSVSCLRGAVNPVSAALQLDDVT